MRFKIIRALALFRRSGAIRQLGWLEVEVSRLKYSGQRPLPWLTYGAIDFIDFQIPPKVRVLELGGGGSTLFWLQKGATVVTIESDANWLTVLERETGTPPTWTLIHIDQIDTTRLTAANLGRFDVIVNDYNGGNRAKVAMWALEHLETDGYLIWDNSDRSDYAEGLELIKAAGLGHVAFFGMGPINSYAWETTIFSRRLTYPSWALPSRKYINY